MDSNHATVFNDEVRSKSEFTESNVLDGCGPVIKSSPDLATRGIAMRVQHSVAAVRALASKSHKRPLAIKFRPPLDQLFNTVWAFFNEHACSLGIAQSVAGVQFNQPREACNFVV